MVCCFPRSEACQLKRDLPFRIANPGSLAPLSSEYGTDRTVKAQFWPWLACNSFKTFQVVPFSHLHVEVRVGLERGELVDFDDPGRGALVQHDVESQHCEAREAHLLAGCLRGEGFEVTGCSMRVQTNVNFKRSNGNFRTSGSSVSLIMMSSPSSPRKSVRQSAV